MKRLLLIAIAFCVTSAFAASDIFIRISGINGKSTDPQHFGWIAPMSFRWGISGPGSATRQAKSATFTVPGIAPYSTDLAKMAATGTHVSVVIDIGLARVTSDQALIAGSTMYQDPIKGLVQTVTLNLAQSTWTTKAAPHPVAAAPPMAATTTVNSNVAPPPKRP